MNRRDLEITEQKEILDILDTCQVIRLGLHDKEDIYILPMNYGYTMEDDTLTFYMHGGLRGKKLELIKASGHAAFELDCEHQLLEGKKPCQYGFSYASIMGKGKISLVEEPQEKINALAILMNCLTGKDFLFDEKLVSIVSVMKLTVTEYSAKRRLAKRF